MMGNQFGMNLANQAMNMGMNQGNMGRMVVMVVWPVSNR